MKKTISFIIIVLICSFSLISCSQSEPKVDFTQLCFDENPSRNGIPLSQIELLYEGVKKAGDTSAKQTLLENCPNAAADHLR